MIKIAIRWLITLLLIYGAYTETGIWTALNLLSLAIGVEAHSFIIIKRR